jgi:anti-sigma B factor antagonist
MFHSTDDREPTRIDAMGIKPPPAFSIDRGRGAGGVAVLLLSGEVDLAAAASLRAHVDAADGTGLVIDLGAVTFADSSALRELLHARQELLARGSRLILAAVPGSVRRLLEITGTADRFETAPGRTEALARLTGG